MVKYLTIYLNVFGMKLETNIHCPPKVWRHYILSHWNQCKTCWLQIGSVSLVMWSAGFCEKYPILGTRKIPNDVLHGTLSLRFFNARRQRAHAIVILFMQIKRTGSSRRSERCKPSVVKCWHIFSRRDVLFLDPFRTPTPNSDNCIDAEILT